MDACVPEIVLVEVTAIPTATFTVANVPVPLNVTTSPDTTPLIVPVIMAALVRS